MYYESCYDCFSIKLAVKLLDSGDEFDRFEVTCTECGTTWEDIIPKEEDINVD